MHKFLVPAALIGLLAGVLSLAAQDLEHHDAPSPVRTHGKRHAVPGSAENPISPPVRPPAEHRPAAPGATEPRPAPALNGTAGRKPPDFSTVPNFHRNLTARRRFRVAPYRPPGDSHARRWRWGEVLPRPFWVPGYWIANFAAYGLPPPPFGTVWVRVGDDALLIDQRSGAIIEVVYRVFY